VTDTPRGIRLNNPCLLRKTAVEWVGEAAGADSDFESFDSLEDGIRAGAKNFVTHWRRGARTVRALIVEHAPDSENDTATYIAFVAGQLGVNPYAMIDLVDLRVLERFVAAVIAMECSHWPIAAGTLAAGCARALGLAPAPATPSATV
jgi:hypothetical protein